MKELTFSRALVDAAGQYVRNKERLTGDQWNLLWKFARGYYGDITMACAAIFYALHEGAEIEDLEKSTL